MLLRFMLSMVLVFTVNTTAVQVAYAELSPPPPSFLLEWETTGFFTGNERSIMSMIVYALDDGVIVLADTKLPERTAYYSFSPAGKPIAAKVPFVVPSTKMLATGKDTFFTARFNPKTPATPGVATIFTLGGTIKKSITTEFILGNYMAATTPQGECLYVLHYVNLAQDKQMVVAFTEDGTIVWRTQLPTAFSLLTATFAQHNNSILLLADAKGIELGMDGTVLSTFTIPSPSGQFLGSSFFSRPFSLDANRILFVAQAVNEKNAALLEYNFATKTSVEYFTSSTTSIAPYDRSMVPLNNNWLVEVDGGKVYAYNTTLTQRLEIPLPLQGKRIVYNVEATKDGGLLLLGFKGAHGQNQVPFLAKVKVNLNNNILSLRVPCY